MSTYKHCSLPLTDYLASYTWVANLHLLGSVEAEIPGARTSPVLGCGAVSAHKKIPGVLAQEAVPASKLATRAMTCLRDICSRKVLKRLGIVRG
jgi:hypothetical protein